MCGSLIIRLIREDVSTSGEKACHNWVKFDVVALKEKAIHMKEKKILMSRDLEFKSQLFYCLAVHSITGITGNVCKFWVGGRPQFQKQLKDLRRWTAHVFEDACVKQKIPSLFTSIVSSSCRQIDDTKLREITGLNV